MLLGPGSPDDCATLSALALRSKGVWGYDPDLLQAFPAALTQAAARRWGRLRVASDPGAEGFYLGHDASRIGTVPSGSVAGRMLPLLELPVSAPAAPAGHR